MGGLIGLDFETYGDVDLRRHGLARYMGSKHFMPLIGSIALANPSSAGYFRRTFDFISDRRGSKRDLADAIGSMYICAHNAPFEQGVLDWLGLEFPSNRFIDSAVVARAVGAGSSLEAAAPQLLDVDKMASGKAGIKRFSIPGPLQEENESPAFDPRIVTMHEEEWDEFVLYCELDAELSLRLVESHLHWLGSYELEYQAVTMDMNRTGWCVDVDKVEEMQRRYLENQEQALADFRAQWSAPELNLNSLPQCKAWCEERGVKVRSMDEKNVAKLLTAVRKKLDDPALPDDKRLAYAGVEGLLVTKQILGGSSLKKLAVILDTAVPDALHPGKHRLLDQYVHVGAGQSCRTSGRSTQMQNLKRLGGEPDDMDELDDMASVWDNEKLATNIRQVFIASDENGRLIVGDFSSVESRGLAYLACADWKIQAFIDGKDMYKVQAEKIFGVPYDQVTKEQRQTGKVGELSCGYGAGSGAVKDFAEGMGVMLSEAESTKLVYDWRDANPEILVLWDKLDAMLHAIVEGGDHFQTMDLPDRLRLRFSRVPTPASLERQHPNTVSVKMSLTDGTGLSIMVRYFMGCYMRGRNVAYYKPSDRKTGDLWRNHFTDPKTKQVRFYELYGGKIAGILTQSFCREIFFQVLKRVHQWTSVSSNIALVGQFHDEIVLDWKPGAFSLASAKDNLTHFMSDPGPFKSFPLAAEIKDDYRYTK